MGPGDAIALVGPFGQRIRQLIDSLRSMPLPATSSEAIEVVRVNTARRRGRLWRTRAWLTAACVSQFVFFGPKLCLFPVVLSVGAMAIEVAEFFGSGGPGGCGRA